LLSSPPKLVSFEKYIIFPPVVKASGAGDVIYNQFLAPGLTFVIVILYK
jgi:hypothetical protein